MTASRTIREFPYEGNPWTIVEPWAAHTRYGIVEDDPSRRLYRKYRGWLEIPRMVSILAMGGLVHLEAWLGESKLTSGSGRPTEITVEPGGLYGIIPRRRARREVNELLTAFGTAPITDANDPDDQLWAAVRRGIDRATELSQRGEYTLAVTAWQETLLLAERRFGRLHGLTLTGVLDASTAMLEVGRKKEALDELRRLVPEMEVVVEYEGPWTLNAKEALAVALAANGLEDEARAVIRGAVDDLALVFGADHPKTIEAKERLDGRDRRTGRRWNAT